MAIIKNWNKSVAGQDVVFNNAYIRVGSIAGSKKQLEATVHVLTKEDGDFIEGLSFTVPHAMNGKNAIAQVYAHIKMLSEFADAVDC